jgi:uncharacterized membrane protein YsdA (DUF1294 family)
MQRAHIVNCLSFLIFGWDKGMALAGGWRIRETSLLAIAALGGSAGAKVGQAVFRHKTRKEPFRADLNRIILVQIFVGVLLLVPQVRQLARALPESGLGYFKNAWR